MTHIRGLITPLITTHEPPSRVQDLLGLQDALQSLGLANSACGQMSEHET